MVGMHLALMEEFRVSRPSTWSDCRLKLRAHAISDTEGLPHPLRRALITNHIICNIRPVIWKNELLVGSWFGIADPVESGLIPDLQAWDNIISSYPDRSFITHSDHSCINYEMLLTYGVKGLYDRCTATLTDEITTSFLSGMKESLKGFSDFIQGYVKALTATKAQASADGYVDEVTRLQTMEDVCSAVKWDKPQTFRQALQLVWFARLALALEGRYAMAFGRLDQYLYPFYLADIDSGRKTPEQARSEAQCLLRCFFSKLGESELALGREDVVNIAIGGITRGGTDGTNELSYLCLDACAEARIPTANLSARFHKDSPNEFYHECARVISTGIGFPAVFNDEMTVTGLVNIGVPAEDARDYCLVGCIETFLSGKQAPWADGRFNLPKCLEHVLISLAKYSSTGCEISFEELLLAVEDRMAVDIGSYVEWYNSINGEIDAKKACSPLMSAFTNNCIETGKDLNDGGTVYPAAHGIAGVGIATLVDSLAALKTLVYHTEKYTLIQVTKMLAANWIGYDEERHYFLRAPKFGNGIAEVDALAKRMASSFCNCVLQHRNVQGGRYLPLLAANVQNVELGRQTGATPDGRYAHNPLSDAASPSHGRDKLGPTAVAHSVCSIDFSQVIGGSVVNQKLDPSCLGNEAGLAKLANYIKTYFSMGGQEMQFNVISPEVLIDAMEHPCDYSNLVVRVSGFSAYFTRLDAAVQADILDRTTQRLG